MTNPRYEDFTELSEIYNCAQFPLSTLFVDQTIDLHRALKLDFDIVPPVMPTQFDVLLSIILHTKHFTFYRALVIDELYNYDYQGGNRDECLAEIGLTRQELYVLLKKMFSSHRDFIKALPTVIANKLLEY